MNATMIQLYNDEAGFLISAELVLVATILVIGMVVGLSEVRSAVNEELEDVASAIGQLNQSYRYTGMQGHKGAAFGSFYQDNWDFCDSNCDLVHTQPQDEWVSIHN